jgi:hypothetical protein
MVVAAAVIVVALCPWQAQAGRYTVAYAPLAWGFGTYRNSVSNSDLIQVSYVGPFRVVFLRPRGVWSRPWPF